MTTFGARRHDDDDESHCGSVCVCQGRSLLMTWCVDFKTDSMRVTDEIDARISKVARLHLRLDDDCVKKEELH